MTPAADPAARGAALALLGLPETATAAQIVDAYRRLVRSTHPDATGRTDPAAAQQFTAIHDAYELLAEPAEHPGPDPTAGPLEPARSHEAPVGPATGQHRLPRPPMGERVFRPRPPIVAGPVIVTPLPSGTDRSRGGDRDH